MSASTAAVVNGRGSSKQPRSAAAADAAPSKRSRTGAAAEDGSGAKRSQPAGSDDSAAKRLQVDGRAVAQPSLPGKRRPRRAAAEGLRDAILGYIDDETGDPPRSGTTKYRQSKEITEMIKVDQDIPIAKERRSEYVWVAAVQLPDGRKKYTWDADVMTPVPKFEHDEDNTCDVCGACCLEVLYEFRCYRRRSPKDRAPPGPAGAGRRLGPAVAYISKECGRGLLGVQSEASKLRERLYRVISADPEQAVETLRELWRVSNKAQQKVITDELRHFAGIELGESDRIVEFRNAEAEHGALHKSADDVFRAASRMMGGVVGPRELASLAVRTALDTGVAVRGYFASAVAALRSRQPLPAPMAPWPKDDVREAVGHLVRAWPVHVELLDSLSKPESFRPGGQGELPTLRLVYLHGCGELHALARPTTDKAQWQALRVGSGDRLKLTSAAFKVAEVSGIPLKGHRKKEDEDLVLPEGDISADCVREALAGISWPDCITRGNVVPEGATVINAFPLGVVNNYAMGLMTSRATIIRPKLTSLLTRFLQQQDPAFTYTTIQLNKDYSARMHVDGNNDGPSYIIALGDYTGGELWIMDEKDGDYEMELKEPMRGYPQLKVGTMLKGRVVNIRNQWFGFNGTIPHAAFPFKGNRMSIVYFSRKGWQGIKEEVAQQLEELNFRIPRGRLPDIGQGAGPPGAAPPQPAAAAEHEPDEVDEVSSEGSSSEEEGGQEPGQAAHSWAARFRVHLGLGASGQQGPPAPGAGRAMLVSCQAGLGVPALALRELLPEGRSCVQCISEADEAAMRFARANLRPEYAFQSIADVAKGEGLCEVHHRISKMPAAGDRDLTVFTGGFHMAVFSGLDTRAARIALVHGTCSDTYHALHRCIAARRPHVAILELRGLNEVSLPQRPGMLRCLVDGVASGGGERSWGLQQLGGYGVELLELRAADFGLPSAATYTFAMLIREDVGGQRSAELAAKLSRALRGLLPRTSARELLLENSNSRLLQVVKEWKKADRIVEPADVSRKLQKVFILEAKEVGVKPGEAPYSELLHKQLGFQEKEWFPHATANQKTFLNLAYAQAKQADADLDSVFVDMSQGIRSQPWREDGLLPVPLASAGGPQLYSFCRHRPLTALEVLGCQGLPARDLDLRGVGDVAGAQLAAAAVPLPVFGAVLCGALAAADLEACPTFSVTSGRAAELLACAADGAAQEELSIAAVRAQLPEEAAEDAQFGGRAAVLLNLVRNASFGQGAPAPGGAQSTAQSGEAKLIHSALAKVAADPDDEGGDAAEQAARGGATEAGGAAGASPDEAKEWPARLGGLRSGKLGFTASAPSIGVAVRWIREAAEDPDAELAAEIIEVGVAYLCNTLAKARRVPAAVAQQRSELLGHLRDVNKEAEAARVSQLLTTVRFLQELDEGSARLAVHKQKDEGMPRYIEGILGKLTAWDMRRGFLDHLAQAAREGWPPRAFVQHGGLELLARWLREAPEHLDKDWQGVGEALATLAAAAPGASEDTSTSLLPFLHATAQRLGAGARSQVASKVEAAAAQIVASRLKDMVSKQVIPKVLQDFAGRPGEPWRRFAVTLDLIQRARDALEQARGASALTAAQWKNAKADFRASAANISARAGNLKEGHWKPLCQLEERLVQSVEASLDSRAGKATERESAEEARREEEKQERFEKEVAALSGLLQDGQLRNATHSGLEEIIAAMQEVRARLKEGLKSPRASAVLQAGEAACRRFCEQPERRSRQRRWLRQQGFGCCAELLEARGLLDGLGDLAEDCRAAGGRLPTRWQAAGLPRRVRRGLAAAVASGRLRRNKFEILDNEVPHGWTREFSQSAGLHYFQRMYGEGQQFEWPTEEEPAAAIGEPPEPALRAPRPQPGPARYVALEGAGAAHCLLCGAAGEEHFGGSAHEAAARHWDRLGDAVQELRLEFQAELGLDADEAPARRCAEAIVGLPLAWFEELARRLAEVKAPDLTHRIFWHRAVRSSIPTQGTPLAMLRAFREILQAARVHGLGPGSPPLDGEPPAASPAAQGALEAGRRIASRLDAAGRLAGGEPSACTDLVSLIREAQARLDACGRERPAAVGRALRAGREAVVRHYEQPARRRGAREWLRRHGLGHCARLLEDAALLDRLPELAAEPKLAEGLGVPGRCLRTLAAALADGRLIQEDVEPGPLPEGWELRPSSSTGLHYCVHSDGRQQWERPPPPEPAQDALAEPPAPSLACPSVGSGSLDEAAYVVRSAGGPPWCLLCGAGADDGHLGSATHAAAAAHWKDLVGRWEGLELEAQRARSTLAQRPSWRQGLQAALHGELHAAICGERAVRVPARVEAAFWHRVVKPRLACLTESAGSCLKRP